MILKQNVRTVVMMYNKNMRNLSVKFLACLLIWQSEIVYACPMCKDIMKTFGQLTQGWFWSILLMLAIPFTMVGFFAGFLVKSYRKNKQ